MYVLIFDTTFVEQTDNITPKMLEDKTFLEKCMDKNLVFLKLIPNLVHHWMDRNKDLFMMICQLGKPIVLLIVSTNEIHWPKLLKTLHNLSNFFKDIKVNNPLKY